MSILFETSFGDLTIDLFPHKCPKASLNFLKLCKLKHYNNALFFRVEKDYVTQIQSEHATTIWSQVSRGDKYFKDQIYPEQKLKDLGLVATANKGSNLNNSQFFITLTKAHLPSVDGKHTVFGKVEQGFEVLRKINQTYVDKQKRPEMNIRILHTFVLDDPFQQFNRMKIPQSPPLKKDQNYLEAVDHLQMLQKCQNQQQIIETTNQLKSKKQALTLTILGDLPDAEIKPPQNILFICKLNPITQERDLQIIFSRFGPIKSVEVVRDWKTGQSLQYAFIEFESPTSCEEAYLKMENVEIDERRIHVDFSQSVSKLASKPKNMQILSHRHEKHKQKDIIPTNRLKKSMNRNSKYDIVVGSTKIATYQPQWQQAHYHNKTLLYAEEQQRRKRTGRKNSKQKKSKHKQHKHRKYSSDSNERHQKKK